MATAATGPAKAPLSSPLRHRYVCLLLAELALIAGSPVLIHLRLDRGQYGLLGFAVFTAGVYAVVGQRRLTAIAIALGAAAMACNVSASFAGMHWASVPGLVFGALFMAFVTSVLLRAIMRTEKVTIETLYGAVAAYIMLGLTWGAIYLLVETVAPMSFHAATEPPAAVGWPDCMFFSFITLTTIGYGDVIPVGNMAKALVTIEGITGIMYPAVMIGRLLTLHGSAARPRE